MMRWEFIERTNAIPSPRFIEIADGTISGDAEFIMALADLIAVGMAVSSPRLGMTLRTASLNDPVSAVCTVEWLAGMRNLVMTKLPDLTDWQTYGELDGPPLITPITEA